MKSFKRFSVVATFLAAFLSVSIIERIAYSQSQRIANGINYLKTTQNADGSWGSTAASLNTNLPTTAAALEALRNLEATTSTNQTNAIQFLNAQAVEENPFLAARVVALSGTSSDTSADVTALLARQNTDGGWGTAEGYESDALDTSFAILALRAANVSNTAALSGALNYLITRQNADGGWALTQGEDSQVFYTAIALEALNSCRLQFAVSLSQSRALAFLRSSQNANGGYGNPSSTAFETAEALLAIFGSGQTLTPAETNAINFLNSAQLANGSWADDPYSTALALRALTSPHDTDADGLPDDYETANGLNPNDPTDAARDNDSDGLANLDEFRRGTNPNNLDTDGDGVDDLTEVVNGSNPRDPASHNRPPVILSQPNASASEGQPYNYQAQATDPDGDSVSFSLLQSPAGMAISGAGLISWTPGLNQVGSFTVIVRASDGRGGSALQQYRVSVLAQGIDLAVASVDATAVTTDTQTLIIGGAVRVDIQNRGGNLFMGGFGVLLFEDRNNDGAYQNGIDNLLGTANFAGSIASNQIAPLDVRVSGVVLFRDNAIYALVDSSNQIPELDETNNIGSSARESRYHPPINEFQPKVKWQYNSASAGTRNAPIVAPLIDTNGDGRVTERDIPAVLIRTDRLTALRGDTGAVIFDVTPPTLASISDNLAVGDLDGDGVPEIVVPAFAGGVHCFNNNGTLRWSSPFVASGSSPAISDLDGDGHAEIIYGAAIINFNGTIRQSTHSPDYRGGPLAASPQVVDLDLDGVPEIVAGPAAFDRNGNPIWFWQTFGGPPFSVRGTLDRGATTVTLSSSNFLLGDGYTAVANLDDDANPEIIVVYDGSGNFGPAIFTNTLWVFEHDGRVKTGFPVGLYLDVSNQETFFLGPPAVADFDGDGEPEIAISAGRALSPLATSTDASQVMMTVYERDGQVKWRRNMLTVEGAFSHGTSPATAFDFDGDGATEIVYQTSQKLIILNGRDGATLYEFGVGTNAIGSYGNPTVADVDNDGLAEIAVPNSSTVDGSPPRSGVLVLGDTLGNWRNARRTWNQWLYHVTNVDEDAGIPRAAVNNWQTLNNSREQVQADGREEVAAPDLTVSKVTINAQNCPASIGITARIGNGGSLHVAAGQRVNFYAGDPAAGGALIGTRQTMRALYPGEFEDVTLTGVTPPASQVFVTVNDPPAETLVQSTNLSLLPHTWAQGSGYSPSCTTLSNLFVYRGIDGQNNTLWRHNFCNIATSQHFYEVHFQFPVNATSVTVQNATAFDTGFLTGTLSFSNGFSTPFTLSSNGEGTITFSEQQSVSWIRLTAATTRAGGPSVSEFIVAGSYREPQFRINEGEGRLGNNKAASAPGVVPCDTTTNYPPVITSAPVIAASIGSAYSYQVQATDPNNDTLTFSLVSAPTGMTISAAGLINWTPANNQSGDFDVIAQVSDGRGGTAQQSFTIDVASATGSNRAPSITSTPVVSVNLNQAYQYDVNATDPDDDVVLFSLPNSPAGASIDLFTGLISWTPNSSQVGTQFFTVEAQDGRGGRSIQSFTVEVNPSQIILPPPPQDRDDDGFDETVDCNDTNPNVNPARTEIPGNGLDDDCNSSTPDALPANSVACSVTTDKRSYNSNSLAQFTVKVRNLSAGLDISGLQAQVTVSDPGGQSVFATTLSVGTLSPHGQFKAVLAFSTQVRPPGAYRVSLDLRFGSGVVCGSQTPFAILSSATQGRGLAGSITASPGQIERGGNSTFNYQVSNIGNVDFADLSLKILVVNATSGIIVQTLTNQTSLSRGQSFSNSKTFNSAGVDAGDYIVILQGKGGAITETVSSASLKITTTANSAPDCSQARPSVTTLWPPNHAMVPVSILGVTDADGDTVTIRIDRIMQDEPTDGLGDGDICPDALGVGTSTTQLRAERSGNGNGRVYTIFFTATDSKGASCQGSVKVCVPHDQNGSCVDDGPRFDSTVCSQ